MQCPKCTRPMEQVTVNTSIIDRCTHCLGIWFDAQEQNDTAKSARKIDIGSASLGSHFNKTTDINCPRCKSVALINIDDEQQPHIQFEHCPQCHGRFFDAGEFRDISEYTLSDLFKKWFN